MPPCVSARRHVTPCVLVSGLGPEKVFIASRDHIPGPVPQPDANMAKEFGCPTFPSHTQGWPGTQGLTGPGMLGTQAAILPGAWAGGTIAQLPDTYSLKVRRMTV